MEYDSAKIFTYEDLKLFTDNFSEENFIEQFQWGKVYRGYYGTKAVTVKKWECPTAFYHCYPGDNEGRLNDEIFLLQHSEMSSHPNLVKLIGYCCTGGNKDQLGIVYDLNPLDSLRNFVKKDSFSWLERIKVILQVASLLEFMHVTDPPHLPCLIRNFCAAHILLDQDRNPKLCDFGMITGGIFPDRRFEKEYLRGPRCYILYERWSERVDMYAFGMILKMLISKRLESEVDKDGYYNHITDDTHKTKSSFAHKSLIAKPGYYARDARKLSKLSLGCTDMTLTITQVMNRLLSLRVVRFYGDIPGIDQIIFCHNRKLASNLKVIPATT